MTFRGEREATVPATASVSEAIRTEAVWGKSRGASEAARRNATIQSSTALKAATEPWAATVGPAANLEGNALMDRQRPPDATATIAEPKQHRTRPDHSRVIAIDGAAAAGKTTVAQALADRLGVTLFDTGVLYRAVTLAAERAGVSVDDPSALATLAATRSIRVTTPTVPDGRLYDVYLDDDDVTWAIRTADVDKDVSAVSAHGSVREALLPVQRGIADGAAVVMVGRDIGTVVTPSAGVKIFLAASLAERARRRHAELTARGIEADERFILSDLERRDGIDAGRAVSPLMPAADATLVDTDGHSIDAVVAVIERIVRQSWTSNPDVAS